MSDLTKLTPRGLSKSDFSAVFTHLFRRLAVHRNTAELYASAEYNLSSHPEATKVQRRDAFNGEVLKWAQDLLENAWAVCQEPGRGKCPTIDPLCDTSTGDLQPLPLPAQLSKLLNTILFVHVTTSKAYSARTRSLLSALAPLDEKAIASTLKDPYRALKEAQQQTQEAKEQHASKGKTLRMVGMGVGAVAGGILIGITGGLAAPLVGAGVTTILGWLGVGGTTLGLLASGLAGSSVVCGALFGVYGAKSTADMVESHTREIRDLDIVSVKKEATAETLAVRLCVTGWLSAREDVTAPWTVFGGDDTFALQWEVDALEELTDALRTLVKTQAMQYVKFQILKRTFLASLTTALTPLALLKIGNIIDNPWMNAKARAIKAGEVLGNLLSSRVFGNRPITLVGYSLGSLVLFEALKYLATLPPADTAHLVQDVFLFGSPVSVDARTWSTVRRVVSGRLVNGYASEDYVLAVLSRASDANWNVAGLKPVSVMGVENVHCEGVDGHLKWRFMIGKCLEQCGAAGVIPREVEKQMKDVEKPGDEDMDLVSSEEAEEMLRRPA